MAVLAAAYVSCTSAPKQPEKVTADTPASGTGAPASDTAGIVEHIKDVYAAINKEQLIQKSVDWVADTTCQAPPMGGTLTYFYRDTEIVKILNVGGEDHGSWKEEYYFEHNQPVFIYQNNTYGGAANPDEFAYQNRYYFKNNQLVKKIESDSTLQLDANTINKMLKTTNRLREAGDNSAAISRILSCNDEE